MQHIFKQSKVGYLGLIFFIYVFYLFFKIFIQSAESGAVISTIITAVLCLLWAKFIYKYWLIFGEKIIVDDNGIRLIHSFNSKGFHWDEITEFGRFRRYFVSHRNGLGLWSYYVKVQRLGEKQINISYENASMMEKLSPLIFKHARNAQFVTLNNVSKIPFIKKINKVPWNKSDT